MMDSLHDRLMVAFRDYFKAAERWETTKFDISAVQARNALGIIRIIARKRRMEIQRLRKERKASKKGKANGKNNIRSDH